MSKNDIEISYGHGSELVECDECHRISAVNHRQVFSTELGEFSRIIQGCLYCQVDELLQEIKNKFNDDYCQPTG